MFAAALIVFRESLEAALFVGILFAATRGLAGRGRWLASGIGAGVGGAIVLALGAEHIAALADGVGQDLVNAAILVAALAMLCWHAAFGVHHGREAARDGRSLGGAVQRGERAPMALAVAVALAVLREGAETVLFVSGLAGGGDAAQARSLWLVGVPLGLAAGTAVGAVAVLGLARVPAHRMFAVTNALIVLLAASIASQLARVLTQSGFVDALGTPLWDSSAWIAQESALGTVLHALVGYDAHPSGLQLLFYVGTVAAILLMARGVERRTAARASAAAA